MLNVAMTPKRTLQRIPKRHRDRAQVSERRVGCSARCNFRAGQPGKVAHDLRYRCGLVDRDLLYMKGKPTIFTDWSRPRK